MSRRKKSKETAIFEAIAGLAGLSIFLWVFVPAFRELVQVILLLGVITVLIGVAIRLLIKFIEAKPTAGYKTIYAETSPTSNQFHARAPIVVTEPYRPKPEPSISEKLRKIDWFQFEKLMGLIYRHRGYSVKRSGGANPDGGVDLIVSRDNEKFLVQCKHWRNWNVALKDMREFLGALTDQKVGKGVYVTLHGYTQEARLFADKHGIDLLDETDLIKMLNDSGLAYSREVSELFASKEKCCPKCGEKMVVRTARLNGNKFWGCSTFPRCRYKMDYAAA